MAPADYAQFILALIFVLGLIGLAALGLRRFGPGAAMMPKNRGTRRLSVTEVLPLDARRRLVLIRRDDKEHLLLLGQQSDCVIEGDIDFLSLPVAEDPAPASPVARRFDEVVRRIGSNLRQAKADKTPEDASQ